MLDAPLYASLKLEVRCPRKWVSTRLPVDRLARGNSVRPNPAGRAVHRGLPTTKVAAFRQLPLWPKCTPSERHFRPEIGTRQKTRRWRAQGDTELRLVARGSAL